MLKWKFPILSDEDFSFKGNDVESMFAKLEQKLKITRAELASLLADLQYS